MNYKISGLPERSKKPRNNGINMIMDEGVSIREVEDFITVCADLVDFVKLGYGTSIVTKDLNKKIELYKEANIEPYFGGTLFEAFYVRDMMTDYRKYLEKYDMNVVEVSDGEINISHDEKCEIINLFSKEYTVLSEVGSKEADVVIPTNNWVMMMLKEKKAGAWKVITEARVEGNIGVFNTDGSANNELVDAIKTEMEIDDVLWEAPLKSQQAWFVQQMGHGVNLGNIPYNEVIALETLRLGLRGDTFFQFLPE